MKTISRDSSLLEVIDRLNNVIEMQNALRDIIMSMNSGSKDALILGEIDQLKKKVLMQGDLIVKYLNSKDTI